MKNYNSKQYRKKAIDKYLFFVKKNFFDTVATYGGKDKILARKRNIDNELSNERLSETNQTGQILSCSSSFPTWVSNEKLDVDNNCGDFPL